MNHRVGQRPAIRMEHRQLQLGLDAHLRRHGLAGNHTRVTGGVEPDEERRYRGGRRGNGCVLTLVVIVRRRDRAPHVVQSAGLLDDVREPTALDPGSVGADVVVAVELGPDVAADGDQPEHSRQLLVRSGPAVIGVDVHGGRRGRRGDRDRGRCGRAGLRRGPRRGGRGPVSIGPHPERGQGEADTSDGQAEASVGRVHRGSPSLRASSQIGRVELSFIPARQEGECHRSAAPGGHVGARGTSRRIPWARVPVLVGARSDRGPAVRAGVSGRSRRPGPR